MHTIDITRYKCKAMENNKETNPKHKKFVSRFEPPLYVPAFTTVKGFHYIHRGKLQGVYRRPEYRTPPIQTSTEEGSQLKEQQVTKWSTRTTHFSFTILIEWEWFWLKKCSEKNSVERVREIFKTTEKLKQRMHFRIESLKKLFFSFWNTKQ